MTPPTVERAPPVHSPVLAPSSHASRVRPRTAGRLLSAVPDTTITPIPIMPYNLPAALARPAACSIRLEECLGSVRVAPFGVVAVRHIHRLRSFAGTRQSTLTREELWHGSPGDRWFAALLRGSARSAGPQQTAQTDGHAGDRDLGGDLRGRRLGGCGVVRPGQAEVVPNLSGTAPGHPLARYLWPGLRAAESRGLRGVLCRLDRVAGGIHGGAVDRHRRQGDPPQFRACLGQERHGASGQRVRRVQPDGLRPVQGGGQEQ